MKRPIQALLAVGMFASALWLSQGTARAQFVNPFWNAYRNQLNFNNPNLVYSRNLASAYAFQNQAAIVRQRALSFSQVNPYYGGFNAMYNPVYATGMNPYMASGYGNPYSPIGAGYGGGYGNPYSPIGGAGGGYGGGGYNPYMYGGYGYGSPAAGYGIGQAAVMNASGQLVNSWEQARILREQANQAKLKTKKDKFDLDMYIKANTPTYTQVQQAAAETTLRRIQTNALPSEVASGKALNLMLKDLEKFPSKKVSLEPLPLSEAVLGHLNVVGKGNYGMGLLRDNGKVSIPIAVQERMTVDRRQALEKQLQHLVKEANNSRIDPNVVKDIGDEIARLRDELVKKVNDVPTTQYLEGKRFLQELDESLRAVQNGQAVTQSKFTRWVEDGKGGRSVQELADYMLERGLRFGPATSDDEAAYRAVHGAMANYDIAMNAHSATKE